MPVVIDPVGQLKNQPAAAQEGETFQFHREIIVCGDDALANTIIDELRGAGARIIRITSAADLLGAGVHRARAVVCAGPNDAVNLEIAFWQGDSVRMFAWWLVWQTTCCATRLLRSAAPARS